MSGRKIVLITTDDGVTGLGIRVLSSCLREQGCEVTLVFLPDPGRTGLRDFRWEELAEVCAESALIGFSFMTHGFSSAVRAREALARHLRVPMVAGGMHATFAPEEVLRHFDAACRGEGEDALPGFVHRLDSSVPGEGVAGWCYLRAGEVVQNPCQPLAKDLNEYPFPDYDLSRQYIRKGNGLALMRPEYPDVMIEAFTVLGSRGCPHACAYCSNDALKREFPHRRGVRHYRNEYLIAHLREAKARFPSIERFWIGDDTFFAKPLEEIRDFSARYRAEIGTPFYILISPLTFARDKMDALRDAGVRYVVMGVQSASERTNFEVYDRKVPMEKVRGVVWALREYPSVTACYDIIGMNPYEGREDLLETLRFIRDLPQGVHVFHNSLAFYPGTAMFRRATEQGWPLQYRVDHSPMATSLSILIHEPLAHKFLHLLILCAQSRMTRHLAGYVPRVLLRPSCLRLYRWCDKEMGPLMNAGVECAARIWMWLLRGRGRALFAALKRIWFLPKELSARVRAGKGAK